METAATAPAPQLRQQLNLFEAISKDDYEGMVQMYATVARDAIVSYSAVRRRWTSTLFRRDELGAEEKLDEYFQQRLQYTRSPIASLSSPRPDRGLGSRVRHCHHHSVETPNGKGSQSLDDETAFMQAMVEDLNVFLSGRDACEGSNDVESNCKMRNSVALWGRAKSRGGQPFKKTKKQPPEVTAAAASGETEVVGSQCARSSSTPLIDKVAHAQEVENVAFDAAAILSNARPPSSFVLFGGGGSGSGAASPEGSGEEGAPLFDGGVANATPASGPSGGGGTGTAIHLACAVDSPFALAILLAMGVDSGARHTAFRRLPVHEAACAGSSTCLALLLELGKECLKSMAKPIKHVAGNEATREDSDALSLAFARGISHSAYFSKWGGRKRTQDAKSCAGKYSRRLLQSENECDENVEATEHAAATEESEDCQSFVATLRQIRSLSREISAGNTSEKDAARKLLADVNLSKANRAALAAACNFSAPQATGKGMLPFASNLLEGPIAPSPQQRGCADGHGNTPLHWASFKNALDCVAALLSHGADPNARAHPSGWTPLHDAAYSNASDAVRLLLDAGADVDARAHSGATPLCFAAQEDAPDAARLLLMHGADPAVRCCGTGNAAGNGNQPNATNRHQQQHHSRFSGYTPLHYCAHYNAYHAARVLLDHTSSWAALETPDLNERLPIHVAVARGSSDVLRELLRGGARVDATGNTAVSSSPCSSPSLVMAASTANTRTAAASARSASRPVSFPAGNGREQSTPLASSGSLETPVPVVVTPVSSPVLRSMIPARPVTSSKPWNCLSQTSIDKCRFLLQEAELNWTPGRHLLFTPADRRAVFELLRVGKRLEQNCTGIFLDLWPEVLSFCGRGWFDVTSLVDAEEAGNRVSIAESSSSGTLKTTGLESNETSADATEALHTEDNADLTQFKLD